MVDVVLDASHGGDDIGGIGFLGTKEKNCTLYIAKACKNILEQRGIEVRLTREHDEWVEGSKRSRIANENSSKCFISIHLSSSDDRRECGLEVVSANNSKEVSKLSFDLITSLSSNSKLNSRGIKYNDLILFKEAKMPAAMVKLCFITNPREEKLLLDERFNKEMAKLLADGIENYLEKIEFGRSKEVMNMNEVDMKKEKNLTPIIGGEIPEKNQAKQWAKNKNLSDEYNEIIDLYWSLYSLNGGINPSIAFAQAIIEITKMKTNVSFDLYNNPGALKQEKTEEYEKFKTLKEGVKAHLDHLALYAGAKGYPSKDSNDPRHFSYLLGACKYVENLSGKWNIDSEYGINILRIHYEILETQTKDVFRESIENIDGLKTQIGEFKSKVVLMGKTLEDVCKEYNQIYKSLEILKDEIVNLENDKIILEKKNTELTKNVSEQKQVLSDIVKIIGGTR